MDSADYLIGANNGKINPLKGASNKVTVMLSCARNLLDRFFCGKHRKDTEISQQVAVDKATPMAYNTGVDGSMTVRRHVEAISRFSFG